MLEGRFRHGAGRGRSGARKGQVSDMAVKTRPRKASGGGTGCVQMTDVRTAAIGKKGQTLLYKLYCICWFRQYYGVRPHGNNQPVLSFATFAFFAAKHQSRVGSFSVERGNAFYTIYTAIIGVWPRSGCFRAGAETGAYPPRQSRAAWRRLFALYNLLQFCRNFVGDL